METGERLMTAPNSPYGSNERLRPNVDARQLWAGGIATAVVAGLIALAGVLLSRWLFNIPLLSPRADGTYGDVHTTGFVLAAAGAALVATALAYLLLLSTPRPMVFFGWIVALATVVAVAFPFSTTAPLEAKAATAVVELVIGVAIGSLISGVAARSVRLRRDRGYRDRDYVARPPGDYRGGRTLPGDYRITRQGATPPDDYPATRSGAALPPEDYRATRPGRTLPPDDYRSAGPDR
jgi:hypothetical protein